MWPSQRTFEDCAVQGKQATQWNARVRDWGMIQYSEPALTEWAERQTLRRANKLNGGDSVGVLNQGASRSMVEGYRSQTEGV